MIGVGAAIPQFPLVVCMLIQASEAATGRARDPSAPVTNWARLLLVRGWLRLMQGFPWTRNLAIAVASFTIHVFDLLVDV